MSVLHDALRRGISWHYAKFRGRELFMPSRLLQGAIPKRPFFNGIQSIWRLEKGGRGCDGISPDGVGMQGFRWAGIESPRSPGKFSDDGVLDRTLFSHS